MRQKRQIQAMTNFLIQSGASRVECSDFSWPTVKAWFPRLDNQNPNGPTSPVKVMWVGRKVRLPEVWYGPFFLGTVKTVSELKAKLDEIS